MPVGQKKCRLVIKCKMRLAQSFIVNGYAGNLTNSVSFLFKMLYLVLSFDLNILITYIVFLRVTRQTDSRISFMLHAVDGMRN